jgi:hypothetical protein
MITSINFSISIIGDRKLIKKKIRKKVKREINYKQKSYKK